MTEMAWRWPRPSGAPTAVLAHRGRTGPWRENTLEAFAAALAAGADGVELDVRRCADGALVVHHDPDVPGAGPVQECRRADLPAWVPTLDDALVTLAGAVVNVEIKNVPTETGYDPSQRIAIDVATILARTAVSARTSVSARTAVSARTNALARMTVAARMASARTMKPELGPTDVVVSSFSPDTLAAVGDADRVAARLPDRDWAAGGAAPLGLLVHPAWDALSALEAATGLRCAALHPHHSQVTAELVRRAHGLGVAVITWTVNDPGELDAVVEAGVDAVITDRVAETLSHLGRPAPN